MTLHFYLRYSTKFGQELLVSGNTEELGNNDTSRGFLLTYFNDQLWHGSLEVNSKKLTEPINYKYILREKKGEMIPEFGEDRFIDTGRVKAGRIVVNDIWNHTGDFENAFFTSAFSNVLLAGKKTKAPAKKTPAKAYTHEFRVKAPLLEEDEIICLSGSTKALHEWDKKKVIPLSKNGNWWTTRINLSKVQFPLVYKYAVYNISNKKFSRFEEGNNRILLNEDLDNSIIILHDGFAKVISSNWKGTGVAIPVFGLRSKKGFGTGEFTDLKLLVNWAKRTGLKMIQLLPVNDTTATYTWKDSYPYSTISAFALHPLLLNLEELAGKKHEAVVNALASRKKQLNKLVEFNYEEVMKYKIAAIRELYHLKKDSIKDDAVFFTYFELNRHWLEPYAAFSYLRDKYKTADFNTWKTHAVYDEEEIQKLVSPTQKHYDEIALHYFTQYHLHLQLKDAAEYAHKNGIIIKGDLPIGICRSSVDAWIEPVLYHMDEQAGAPPDAFTAKGQNWGFPTYNWEAMQKDDFTWWRKRFEQMSNYFDAFRIDHILGFFRIWSIPMHSVEGLMARFVPAIPVSINEIFEKNIAFERHRYIQPYITDPILTEVFGDKKKNAVKKTFFTGNKLKENFNTQRKVEEYFSKNNTFDDSVRQGLYDLISNVIFFEVPDSNGQKFHFRISMEETSSFKNLDKHSREELKKLYIDYFYHRQDELWRKEAMKRLPGLKRNTAMLVCGEDLGMVPHCVPQVMEQLGILSLEIQRMPKKAGIEFFHPRDAPYLSVVSPSTHDMSTIRAWWEEDSFKTRRFYNLLMGHGGEPPTHCEPWINKEIVLQHLYSPAMWTVFQLQDLMGMAAFRREDPEEERINDPSQSEHYWNYRMHINLEDLLKENVFNDELKGYIHASGR